MVEKLTHKPQNKADNVKSLLSTPTNNFGIGLLFKKFLILSEE